MSKASAGYVVKLVYDDVSIVPRWVTIVGGLGFGGRDLAIVFPNRKEAHSEAAIWKQMLPRAFAVFVEPA
jgi:hypothetical protein